MTTGLPAPVLAAGLAAAGVALAGPISVALAKAAWTQRSPRAALVLWQAVCLGAGVSMIGALTVLAVEPLGGSIVSALSAGWVNLFAGHPFTGLSPWRVACLLLAAASIIGLLSVLIRCLVLAVRRRRTHRMLLDLLSRPRVHAAAPELLAGVRVLDHPSAVAYTVPGWHSRVVMSAGLLDLLTPAELAAVLDHERAHLRSRHDILILPFQAWAASLGAVPGVRLARVAVAELAEMLADDLAAKRSGSKVLACALAKVTLASGAPEATDAAAALSVPMPTGSGRVAVTTVTDRVRRLLEPRPLALSTTIAVYVLAALLLVVPVGLELIGWR